MENLTEQNKLGLPSILQGDRQTAAGRWEMELVTRRLASCPNIAVSFAVVLP